MSPSPNPPPPPRPEIPPPTTIQTRPIFQNPSQRPPNPHPFYSPPPPRIPSNPNPNPNNYHQLLAPRPPPHDPSQFFYPGRGYLSRPVAVPASRPVSRMPVMFPYVDQGFMRPGSNVPNVFVGPGTGGGAGGGVMPGFIRGVPVSGSHHLKVGHPSASISDINGHKEFSERNRDGTFTIIRDRKVRLTENASLYTLCRSWLKNGFPEEIQPQYLDTIKPLPKPLPAAQVVESPDKKAEDKEEDDEDKGSFEDLSEKELLQRHINRAKRIRSRLREERLQRITRYKTRLALLLPPMVEQHFKNESAAP